MYAKNVDHYYLFALATDVNNRGIGVGKALMNFAEERFGPDEIYYLENPNEKNLVFYNGLGYKVVSNKTIKGALIFYILKNYKKDGFL